MNLVCGKCGDIGYPEILLCCFMCQDAYEHRYCFNKASDIFREDVKWGCEDCLATIPKKSTPKKIRNLPSRRSKRISSRNLPAGEISPLSSKRTKPRSESSDETEHPKLLIMDAPTECNQIISCIPEKSENKDTQTSPSEIEGKEVKGCPGGTIWIDLPTPGSPKIDDNHSLVPHQNCNFPARPVVDPVWKGSFKICDKAFGIVEGVAAHLSTLACPRAQQEARLLPVSLHPCVVPTASVWPKSLQAADPKDESIGLYFFPERERDGESFDFLVNGMISDDLAMICVVENAELLVFTSLKLPCDYWRFQGKRYLWGVFRAKQTVLSIQSSSNNLSEISIS